LHGKREHQLRAEDEERLSLYLDGYLPDAEQRELAAHLEGCATCQRELEELRRLRALLQRLPQPTLPHTFTLPLDAPVPAGVAGESALPHPGRQHGKIAVWIQQFGAVAAMLGLVLMMSGLVTLPHSSRTTSSAPATTPGHASSVYGGPRNMSAPHSSQIGRRPSASAAEAPGASASPTPTPCPTETSISGNRAACTANSTLPTSGQTSSNQDRGINPSAASSSGTSKHPSATSTTHQGSSSNPGHQPAIAGTAHAATIRSPEWLNRVSVGIALLVLGILTLITGTVLRRRGPPQPAAF